MKFPEIDLMNHEFTKNDIIVDSDGEPWRFLSGGFYSAYSVENDIATSLDPIKPYQLAERYPDLRFFFIFSFSEIQDWDDQP